MPETTGEFWAMVAALATLLTAIVAIWGIIYARGQLKEVKRARLEQAQPYVFATPIPELSVGRQACLLIRNYGSTAAHEIKVHFPGTWVIAPISKLSSSKGYSGTRDLQLSASTLAPGQEIYEWISIATAPDKQGVYRADVEVSYTDWLQENHTIKYEIAHGPTSLFSRSQPLGDIATQLQEIQRTMQRWSSFDRRALVTESRFESQSRLFDSGTEETN